MPYSKGFAKIRASVVKEYLHKPVPKAYQARYGKRYDSKDVKSFAYAIAKSKGIRTDKKY